MSRDLKLHCALGVLDHLILAVHIEEADGLLLRIFVLSTFLQLFHPILQTSDILRLELFLRNLLVLYDFLPILGVHSFLELNVVRVFLAQN